MFSLGTKRHSPKGIQVVTADTRDLDRLISLRSELGWLENAQLLRILLQWENARTFVIRDTQASADMERTPLIGSTCATANGGFGVIGNVVVRQEYRMHGYGRQLMDAAFSWFRTQSVPTILLDATEVARPVYSRLGFVTAGERSVYATGPVDSLDWTKLNDTAENCRTFLGTEADLERVHEMDKAAFGGNRIGLLAKILETPHAWMHIAEDTSGEVTGYALTYILDEAKALLRIGPIIAKSRTSAAALIMAALGIDAPWRHSTLAKAGVEVSHVSLNVSIPSTCPESIDLFQKIGAHIHIDDLIMRRDAPQRADARRRTASPFELPPISSEPTWVYAWLSNMVF